MRFIKKYVLLFTGTFVFACFLKAQDPVNKDAINRAFHHPSKEASPWVFWYWMNGCVSKEGITADLEAMKEVGISGAYLMPIKDTSYKIDFQPQIRQLTPEWFAMVAFAVQEAKRLGLELGIHVSDGFALAGGPWITAENSMQKIVWTKTYLAAGSKEKIILQKPAANENYYKDIAVFAYPANYQNELAALQPVITTSNGTDAGFLTDPENKKTFRSDTSCWIQYSYSRPVTIRQIKIKKQNNAYQSQRFIVQQSNDGNQFETVDTLHPPKHGWQDAQEPYTHSVKNFKSKYIRLLWDKKGSLPGSEDLDAAKWKPVLRVQGIFLSDEPVISNYEAKNGSVWRIAAPATTATVNNKDIIPFHKIINLTKYLKEDGSLNWKAPYAIPYCIVRIGHTSTGMKNETGGGGKGLEADKFSVQTVTQQFTNWFGKIYGVANGKEVIRVLHIDSWECGSQNWGAGFAEAFQKKRGYALVPYLLVYTGTPISSLEKSESVLADIRQTIAELVNDHFYGTLKELAHAKNLKISAESIAPTFVSDGLLHYKNTDIPMGEFWQNSPTHDKPTDLLDAISGAHIYGKNIVQAEAFTTLRINWNEYPGSMKTLGDRVFASGINKMVLHVFVHNPWTNRKPGMTLDGIGLYFQRDQTWFKQSKAWIRYLTRCAALLQLGKPVVDIGVFTGTNYPQRSLLPYQLIETLPGLFGKERVAAEKKRLENEGTPLRTIPDGVTHSANMADPEKDVDAINGYQYDCFNTDVLMAMTVQNKKIYTPGGASYKVLVIPDEKNYEMPVAVKNKIQQLLSAGAVIVNNKISKSFNGKNSLPLPFKDASFKNIGIPRDVEITGNYHSIAWTHRKTKDADIYFFANQKKETQRVGLIFSNLWKRFKCFDPAYDFGIFPKSVTEENGYTKLEMEFQPNQSLFIVFYNTASTNESVMGKPKLKEIYPGNWELEFLGIKEKSPVQMQELKSWTELTDPDLKYYSGTVNYTSEFLMDSIHFIHFGLLNLEEVNNIATVSVNGKDCGTLWTYPYNINISDALKPGKNTISISVSNTWHNRLIGDQLLPTQKRTTFTTAPFYLKDKELEPAGITGTVKIIVYDE